jgi:serine/threonine-protein kinase
MPATHADSDLLFGLIALHNGLIVQEQLLIAFRAWTLDKQRPLADHLVDCANFDDADRAAVEALMARHMKRHGDDAEDALTEITASHSIRECLACVDDFELGASLARMGSGRSQQENDSERTATYSVGTGTSDGQRFRILRPHAKGGLGAVSVALDSELHREVALKQILDEQADDPESRKRFLLEAEITGGLEHPGIVPVYGLGWYPDGRPYYAMRLIRGESFKEVIDAFHADDSLSRDPGRRSLELRKLLRRFLDVCNAIDYAHSRGVLHRDIKPRNIVIGKHGETLVVDWGLAKAVGRSETDPAADERTLVPAFRTGVAETLPGSALGTPAYMSPEQAGGYLDRLGPRSDVYGLGATLYCLLTGKPPFAGEDVGLVLRQVQAGGFRPPRAIDPSVDRTLDRVCLKAMALDPSDRYGSALGLADDIERWMADEPVSAYAEPWHRRFSRWFRRHRTRALSGAAVALIAVTAAAIMSATIIEGGRRRESYARQDAETNLTIARSALEDYQVSVNENTLLKLQDSVELRGLRQELLSTALKYYKRVVNQHGDDPNFRQQLANAYFHVGEITQEIDSSVEAIEAFQSARRVWESLAADSDGREMQSRLAACDLSIGKQRGVLGDLHGAMTSFNQARTILEPLAVRYSDVAAYQSSLANCYLEIGIIQGKLQAGDQGLSSLEKAIAIQQRLTAQFPSEAKYRQRLAEMTNVLGFVYGRRLDNADAIRCFEEVQKICQSLLDHVTDGPKPVKLLDLLALSHYNIATIRVTSGQFDLALESLRKSLEYRSELATAHPSVTRFRENVGKIFSEIADVNRQANQDDKAFSSIQSSIDILDKLVQSHPDQATYHGSLGRSLNTLGCLHDKLRHNSQAIPVFEKAVKEQELAISQSPDYDEFKVLRSVALENLGEQYVDLGQMDRALPYYREAIQIRRQLGASHPEKLAYLLDLAEALCTLGTLERHAGDSTAALVSFEEARGALEGAEATTDDNAAVQIALGAVLVREAGTLADLKQPEKAHSTIDRAVKILYDVSASSTEDAIRRAWQSEALWELARVLRGSKNAAEANKTDARRVALWQGRPSGELVSLALRQSGRAAAIGYGKTRVSSEAQTVRDLDLDQAAANLRLAIAHGFNDLPTLRAMPDAWMLLDRSEFRGLIKR